MSEQTKVALVTGAGRGIGRAIALQLAGAGFDIVVHYCSSGEEAAAVGREVEGLGRQALVLRADIARAAEIEALFDALDSRLGRLDVLVNNAGLVRPTPLASLDETDFDELFAVNVRGPAVMARESAKRMGAGGRILNVSSSRAHFPAAGTGGYAGSKAALEMLTCVWAAELAGQGITVNAVAPGPTSPGMIDRAPSFLQEAAKRASPFARLGSAAEVARAAVFLCSEEASWVTGQVLLV
ncbi:MAG TPA: SDR family oxidoreductase, partial [Alphaproteobacteria bacterium]|nr:SDR family oxidoreductase [Alphaproteobacteria bacterium]